MSQSKKAKVSSKEYVQLIFNGFSSGTLPMALMEKSKYTKVFVDSGIGTKLEYEYYFEDGAERTKTMLQTEMIFHWKHDYDEWGRFVKGTPAQLWGDEFESGDVFDLALPLNIVAFIYMGISEEYAKRKMKEDGFAEEEETTKVRVEQTEVEEWDAVFVGPWKDFVGYVPHTLSSEDKSPAQYRKHLIDPDKVPRPFVVEGSLHFDE